MDKERMVENQLYKVIFDLYCPSCQRVDAQPSGLTGRGIMMGVDQKDLAEAVGRAIARQRTRAGLTQEEVAERLGIGNEAVSRIERGIVIPNIARLFDFASIFGCEATELLSETSPRPDDQASRISRLLTPLDQADRQLLVEMIERLSERLGQGRA
jgi:transcriptional regulator with XRE-family HTH domain